MKINLWGINYYPEHVGIAPFSTQWCEHLVLGGHDVSVTTGFPYYPQWTLEGATFARTDLINGVVVRRHWMYVPKRVSIIGRIIHELSFVIHSTIRQLFYQRPDVMIVVSPPLLVGVAAWVVSRIRNIPFLFHIQDLQPDAAIRLGMIKQGWLTRLLLLVESFVYNKADLVSTISAEMRAVLIEKGVPANKLRVLPNTLEMTDSKPERGIWRKKFGFDSSTAIVSYGGNIGVKQGLDAIIDAARLLNGKHPVRFVVCGDGADKPRISAIVDAEKLENMSLFGLFGPQEYRSVIIDSDICLITQKPGTGASFLPSKLLGILADARPVVTNADPGSALHVAVTEGRFGVVTADSGAALAECIVNLLEQPQGMQDMGLAGQNYVKQFDKSAVLPQVERVLSELVEKRRI